MRLHTRLTAAQVAVALQAAKDAGKVTPDVRLVTLTEHGSKTHPRAYEFQLGTSDRNSLPDGYQNQLGRTMHVRRRRNSGDGSQVHPEYAATWHEHGWFFREVFLADPDARIGDKSWGYADQDDFDIRTEFAFADMEEWYPAEGAAVAEQREREQRETRERLEQAERARQQRLQERRARDREALERWNRDYEELERRRVAQREADLARLQDDRDRIRWILNTQVDPAQDRTGRG